MPKRIIFKNYSVLSPVQIPGRQLGNIDDYLITFVFKGRFPTEDEALDFILSDMPDGHEWFVLSYYIAKGGEDA